MNASDIERFWTWFSEHERQIASEFARVGYGTFLRDLDARLRALNPDVRWEIGPDGDTARLFLALSPNGVPRRLRVTAAIVGKAPELSGWTFLSSKPPKRWVKRRLVTTVGGRPVTFDFDTWRFALERSGDMLCFEFLVPESELSEAALEGAAWLLLESELGEARALERVEDVRCTSMASPGSDSWRPIDDLAAAAER